MEIIIEITLLCLALHAVLDYLIKQEQFKHLNKRFDRIEIALSNVFNLNVALRKRIQKHEQDPNVITVAQYELSKEEIELSKN